jgi:copper(I)-binding protein
MPVFKSFNRTTLSAALATIVMTAAMPAAAGQADRIEITGAHALVSPMHEGGGVFMTLRNTGDTDAVITAAKAPVAGTVALHRCNRPGGMPSGGGSRQMQRPEPASGPMTIPAGSTVTLQRGSRHLCMTDSNQSFKLGAEFPLTLTFQDGSSKTVPLKIEGVAKPRRGMTQGQGGQP